MKRISAQGEWKSIYHLVSPLMKDGWHISRFDKAENGRIDIEIYREELIDDLIELASDEAVLSAPIVE